MAAPVKSQFTHWAPSNPTEAPWMLVKSVCPSTAPVNVAPSKVAPLKDTAAVPGYR